MILNEKDAKRNFPNEELEYFKNIYDSKNQINCIHDWNEVRVWSFGVTYIKYCNRCNLKVTLTK